MENSDIFLYNDLHKCLFHNQLKNDLLSVDIAMYSLSSFIMVLSGCSDERGIGKTCVLNKKNKEPGFAMGNLS